MVAKFSNIIYKDGLDDLLLRLKCGTCTKNTNKIGEEESWQAIKSYSICFLSPLRSLGKRSRQFTYLVAIFAAWLLVSWRNLVAGTPANENLKLEFSCWHVLFKTTVSCLAKSHALVCSRDKIMGNQFNFKHEALNNNKRFRTADECKEYF